jgi:hypothetical protein
LGDEIAAAVSRSGSSSELPDNPVRHAWRRRRPRTRTPPATETTTSSGLDTRLGAKLDDRLVNDAPCATITRHLRLIDRLKELDAAARRLERETGRARCHPPATGRRTRRMPAAPIGLKYDLKMTIQWV